MDPLTQGLLGAVAVQSLARREEVRTAAAFGFVAGTLADLDVFIRSASDPLLFLDYHRHFTHALVFIPVAATLLAGLVWPWLGWLRRHTGLDQLSIGRLWWWLAVAYGTHGLLDACTTYGTQLLWPFSSLRVAWNVVAVIDPGLTLPALVLAVLAWSRRSPKLGRAALCGVVLWLGLGLVQRERANTLLAELTASRGEVVERGGAKPTLFNLLLWRGVWQTGDNLHVAALRPGWFGPDRVSPVATAPAFDRERDLPDLDPASTAARDIERFRHFSDGWLVALGRDHEGPADDSEAGGSGGGRPMRAGGPRTVGSHGSSHGPVLIGDLRYATLPDEIRPLWAITIDPEQPSRHADYVTMREINETTLARFRAMVSGEALTEFAPASPNQP